MECNRIVALEYLIYRGIIPLLKVFVVQTSALLACDADALYTDLSLVYTFQSCRKTRCIMCISRTCALKHIIIPYSLTHTLKLCRVVSILSYWYVLLVLLIVVAVFFVCLCACVVKKKRQNHQNIRVESRRYSNYSVCLTEAGGGRKLGGPVVRDGGRRAMSPSGRDLSGRVKVPNACMVNPVKGNMWESVCQMCCH